MDDRHAGITRDLGETADIADRHEFGLGGLDGVDLPSFQLIGEIGLENIVGAG